MECENCERLKKRIEELEDELEDAVYETRELSLQD